MRRATATPPAPSGGTIDATCRVTIRSASRSAATDGPAINAVNATATRNRMDASLDTIWSQPRCACASLGASSFASYVLSLKRDDGNCMAEVLLRPRGVRPQRPGNHVSSRPPILSDAASPVAVLSDDPEFYPTRPGRSCHQI